MHPSKHRCVYEDYYNRLKEGRLKAIINGKEKKNMYCILFCVQLFYTDIYFPTDCSRSRSTSAILHIIIPVARDSNYPHERDAF